MTRKVSFLSCLLVVGLSLAEPSMISRGGSDGPTPFTKISTPKKIQISLGAPFSSFAYLEKRQAIAYVDTQKQLRFFDLVSGQETLRGSFEGKLYPVVDPAERVLLSDNLRDIKVIRHQSKFKDLRLPMSKQFGFWSEGKLWMIKGLNRISSQRWKLSFFWYSPEINQVGHRNCVIKLEEPLPSLELSTHHSAPYFSLYSQDSKQNPSMISMFFVSPQVRKGFCRVEQQMAWDEQFDGKVKSAGLMQNNRELLVLTDGAKANLYYSFGTKLYSTKLPSGSPWLLNPNSSVLVNLTAKRGIDIYSMESEKYFNINMVPDRLLVAEKQIWVDSSGERLFISAPIRRNKVSERVLYMMSLKKLNE